MDEFLSFQRYFKAGQLEDAVWQLEKAIQKLDRTKRENKDFENNITLLISRLSRLKNENQTLESKNVAENSISNAVLRLFEDVKEASRQPEKTYEVFKEELINLYKNATSSLGEEESKVKLADVYVEQGAKVDSLGEKSDTGEKTLLQHITEWLSNSEYKRNNPLRHKYKQKLMLVLGSPGQGKTSFCYKLVHDLLIEEEKHIKVYYVKLQKLTTSLKDLGRNFFPTLSNELSLDIKSNEADDIAHFFVLDGLDELLLAQNPTDEDINQFFNSLDREVSSNTQLTILITCRTGLYYFPDLLEDSRSIVFQLSDFTPAQQEDWLRKRRKVDYRLKLTDEKLAEYRDNTSLKELLCQPLLLEIIAELGDISSGKRNKAYVYSELFKSLSEKNKRRSLGELDEFRSTDIRKAVAQLAYWISCDGNKLLPEQTIKDKVSKLKDSNPKVCGLLQAHLPSIMSSYFLHKVSDEDKIEFIHNSFREYATADFIANGIYKAFSDERATVETVSAYLRTAITPLGYQREVLVFLGEIFLNNPDKYKFKEAEPAEVKKIMETLLLSDFLKETNAHSIEEAVNNWMFCWLLFRNADMNPKVDLSLASMKRIEVLMDCATQRERIPMPFSDMTFQRLSLRGRVLKKFDFSLSKLKDSNFAGSDMEEAIFRGADLSDSDFRGCSLQRADFEYSDFKTIEKDDSGDEKFNYQEHPTILNGVKFGFADLSQSKFFKAEVRGASFNNAILENATFLDCNLDGADFTSADLRGTAFKESSLVNTTLRFAKVDNPDWFDKHEFSTNEVDLLHEEYSIVPSNGLANPEETPEYWLIIDNPNIDNQP